VDDGHGSEGIIACCCVVALHSLLRLSDPRASILLLENVTRRRSQLFKPNKEMSKSKTQSLSDQEIQSTLNKYQQELSGLASKIGELETEAEEHELVLSTLEESLAADPDRKCFRLIGGVLVERTVKDVVPALSTNRDGIKQAISALIGQYKSREDEFQKFTREQNVSVRS